MPKRKAKHDRSVSGLITAEEAAELADMWKLPGPVRNALVHWLPIATKSRRDDVEPAFSGLRQRAQRRRRLSALEKHLKRANALLPHCLGEMQQEASAPLLRINGQQLDMTAWQQAQQDVKKASLAVEELIPLVKGALRRLDKEKQAGSRARPQDDILARGALHFHATWLKELHLVSREVFCNEVLKRAGVAEGSIDTLLKAAAKPIPGSVTSMPTLDGSQ